jgi:hypothetical protein
MTVMPKSRLSQPPLALSVPHSRLTSLAKPDGNVLEQNLEVLVRAIILDRNSQVCFHKLMSTGVVTKISHARWRAFTIAY